MKILYSWLKDYIDINFPPEKLADDLSMFAHEAENITKLSNGDAVLDLEITPNRGDCLSHLGIARQVGAMYDRKIKNDTSESLRDAKTVKQSTNKDINITISDPKICPRYSAIVIENIDIKDSPKIIQERLKACGFRPINNIVDITNYLMLDLGQPLHAFDNSKIKNHRVNIRRSIKDETIITLDGKTRTLPNGSIIIDDEEKIFDLAGIMGGALSEIDNNTKTILLQAAIFDPILIRKTSKTLHHQTDASYRYERGVDFEGTTVALEKACTMIREICPDAKFSNTIDVISIQPKSHLISYSDEKINNLIGTNLRADEIKNALERMYFKVDNNQAQVPSFRNYDVSIWQDLAEEVARIIGFNKIKRIEPIKSNSNKNSEWLKREKIKDELTNIGFTEIYSYSFADRDKLGILGEDINHCVEIVNPISPETRYLRPSLLSSLLSAVSKNPWAPDINIFELEKVFNTKMEKWQLGIASAGKSDSLIKKAVENICPKAIITKIQQNILDSYKIRRQVNVAIIDIDKIENKISDIDYQISKNMYKAISKFPPTIIDLAFVVSTDISSSDVNNAILGASDAVLLTECFDEYSSEKLGQNNKNIAFHIWLQDMSGPVSEADASKITLNIIKIIENKFNAKLRS